MASLTHVCMWSDNGWKRITAEQAARLHPGGTVSAHSGLFMCELCGQYVILTDGDIRIRYFKHSAYEKAKIVLNVHSELAIQSLTVLRNTIYQSVSQASPRLLSALKSV